MSAMSNDKNENPDLEQEELILGRRAAVLSGFLRDEINASSTAEERCRQLRVRIAVLEKSLLEVGRLAVARMCLWTLERPVKPLTGEVQASPITATEGGGSSFSKRKSLIAVGDSSPSAKRTRLSEKENEASPCLRCKILKKRCDAQDTCQHCPTQSFDIENDFWKVLGCFRSPLKDLASVFCPPFSRSTCRTIRYADGRLDTINYMRIKSRISPQKRWRIWNMINMRPSFAGLEDGAWSEVSQRQALSRDAATAHSVVDGTDADTEYYEAAWAVLQVVSIEACYHGKTEYNFFALIRSGNLFAVRDPQAWEPFTLAKRLLRHSVEIYLLEKLCANIAAGKMIPPFDPSSRLPNTLVLVDLLEDMEIFLSKFERICSRRAKLTGQLQMACFYALLVFGITKSVLIDAYAVRPQYEVPSSWNETEAMRITSVYKALVSVFCWASKTDAVLQNGLDVLGPFSEVVKGLLHTEKMAERGIKGTKDFLLGLGSCLYNGGGYNGFLVQKVGREKLPSFVVKGGEKISPGSRFRKQTEDAEASVRLLTTVSEQTRGHSPSASEGTLDGSTSSSPRFVFVGHDGSPKQKSRRNKALDAVTRENAKEMRKIGACLNCWANKVTCSEGVRCTRCRQNDGSKGYRFCNRGSFSKIFTDLIIPDVITSLFTTNGTEDYIADNKAGISGPPQEIELFRGEVPMKLQVHVYAAFPNRASAPHTTIYGRYRCTETGKPLGVETLPVGLAEDIDILEEKCLKQTKRILKGTSFSSYVGPRGASPRLKQILDILHSFYKESHNKLVENSLLLYLALCNVNRLALLTESSAFAILERLRGTAEAGIADTSRTLNRQMKHAMLNVCRQLTIQVLTDLEKFIRARSKESWPTIFATITLLSFSIEQVEILIEDFVLTAKISDGPLPEALKREPQRSCRALEDIPFGQLTSVFHTLYRTSKGGSGAFNPFRDDFEDGDEILGPAASEMVRRIKDDVLNEGGRKMLEENDTPLSFEDGGNAFAERNAGRLVAKFLLSFVL